MKLEELDIFQGIDTDNIKKLLSCSKSIRRRYKEGDYLFRQTDKPIYMFVILEGSAIISKDFSSGKQDILLHVREGDVLGEIFFNPDVREYWYDAVAMTDMEVLMLPWEFFYGFCQNACMRHQTITKNMLEIFSQRNYEITRKAHILSCNILRERIALWLLNSMNIQGKVSLTMNREQLAAYLGVARPSLSRELMKMQEEGILTVDKNSIRVLDFQALEDFR
ncbi:MAG: Crp/Fnr family transcriptional regulator [Lachnospiraceae bacterium]